MPNTRTKAQKTRTATKRGNTARVTRLKGGNTKRNPRTFTERPAGKRRAPPYKTHDKPVRAPRAPGASKARRTAPGTAAQARRKGAYGRAGIKPGGAGNAPYTRTGQQLRGRPGGDRSGGPTDYPKLAREAARKGRVDKRRNVRRAVKRKLGIKGKGTAESRAKVSKRVKSYRKSIKGKGDTA